MGSEFPAERLSSATCPGPREAMTSFVADYVRVNMATLQVLGLTIPPALQPLVTEWVQ
jgi:hypothetical protein